jgi:hypothetical protein
MQASEMGDSPPISGHMVEDTTALAGQPEITLYPFVTKIILIIIKS